MFLFSFRLCLYSLILSIYTTSITSLFIDFNAGQPATFWVDQSCLLKGFTSTTVQESLNIATRGSYRVINRNDGYQGWLFQKLFKVARVFNVDPTEDTVAWVVVEVLGWIGAMTLGNNRDTADVRIYCDNDRRWTPVPDDPIAIAAGILPNSERYFGEDEEYQDPINFMRRDTDNVGCAEDLTLGVTYTTESPEGFGFSAPPANYHSPRQTITICDLAFTSPIRKFSQIAPAAWASMQMSNLALIPTFVLLHQLLGLEPYGFGTDAAVSEIREDAWSGVLSLTAVQAELLPTPYLWNAVLAYAADLGWGVSPRLTQAQYEAGQNLFRYSRALIDVPFVRSGPITLPTWLTLPPNAWPQPGGAGKA